MNKLFKYLLLILFISNNLIAEDIVEEEINDDSINTVDCILLSDEDSIICKYIHKRIDEDKYVEFIWIDPSNTISRQRTMLIPAGHGSIYDYRFINGRASGKWTFEVLDNNQSYKTNFIIE